MLLYVSVLGSICLVGMFHGPKYSRMRGAPPTHVVALQSSIGLAAHRCRQ